MRFNNEAIFKRLPDEADVNKFRRNTQIQIEDDDKLIIPMIRLLNTMLINGYQS